MEKYERIKREIIRDANKRKEKAIERIKDETCDLGLKRYSTPLRLEQYKSGKITRQKAVDLAIKRAVYEIEKDEKTLFNVLDTAAKNKDVTFVNISIEWTKSKTWGYNPTATIYTNNGTFTGHASGCGYDKESAAVASALNKDAGVLKLLYEYKENKLAAGETGTNHNIIGYGSGYGILSYFEGGVGMSCFVAIFKKLGFDVYELHSKKNDYYTIVKEV